MTGLEAIKRDFMAGLIGDEELHRWVEPVLWDSALSEESVIEIANGIELAIYTQVEPEKSRQVVEWIDHAIQLLESS